MARVNYQRPVSDAHLRIVLQRVADFFDRDVNVHSGDRNHVPRGGSRTSLHLAHRAADFHVAGITDAAAFAALRAHTGRIFDRTEGYEVIHHGTHTDTGGPHLHIGHYAGRHAGQVLFKTEGLTAPGGHYYVTQIPIAPGTPIESSAQGQGANRVSGVSTVGAAFDRLAAVRAGRATIRAAVGRSGANLRADVETIQMLLNRARRRLRRAGRASYYNSLTEDGICGNKTLRAITLFQHHVARFRRPDGRVDPGGRTLRLLNAANTGTPDSGAARAIAEGRTQQRGTSADGNPGNITADHITTIQPALAARSAAIAADMNQAMRDAQITTRIGQAMFLAQILHEMGTRDDLNEIGGRKRYGGQVYDYFFYMYDIESPDARRRQVARNLGNTQPGDGARFHGRGYIQLTGRNNYESAGRYLSIDLVGNPARAAEPAIAVRVAAWYWRFGNGNLNNYTRADTAANFDEVTRRINGGLNGIEHRRTLYRLAKQALGV